MQVLLSFVILHVGGNIKNQGVVGGEANINLIENVNKPFLDPVNVADGTRLAWGRVKDRSQI